MVADKLGIHDVIALARTCRVTNGVLGRIVYLRAKDSTSIRGRPYFLQAVDDGNLAAVERFVEAGAALNMTDVVTRLPGTAIHSCAYFGHVEMAVFLIDKGIDVSAVDYFGRGVIHSVVMGARPLEAMATLLVEAGADVNGPREWETPLQGAEWRGDIRMMARLIDLGACWTPRY